jgi:hypothetical protein
MFGAVATVLGGSEPKLRCGRMHIVPLVRRIDSQPVTSDRLLKARVLILLRVMTQNRTRSSLDKGAIGDADGRQDRGGNMRA